MVASTICNAADLNVPVIPGAEKPLDGPIRQPKVPQTEVLTRWPHETVFNDVSATEFMAETIRSHPGEVVLLAVGQMANIADLFTSHPDIPSLVKSLHMMLGRFTDRQPEAPNSGTSTVTRHQPQLSIQPVYRARSLVIHHRARCDKRRDDDNGEDRTTLHPSHSRTGA